MTTKLEAQIDQALKLLPADKPKHFIVRPARPKGGKKRHTKTGARGVPSERDLERVLSMLGDGRTPQHRKAVAGAAMDLVKSGATVTVYSGVRHKGKKKVATVTLFPKSKVRRRIARR